MRKGYSLWLVMGMLGGILVGWASHHHYADPGARAAVAAHFSIVTDVFLRLIKMIIVPLVLATLTSGIAQMENAGAVGRIGLKAMTWFIGASVVSLTLGLLMAQWLRPGAGMNLSLAATVGSAAVAPATSIQDLLIHAVPTSLADGMARNDILQVVVFAVFFGVAITSIKDQVGTVLAFMEQLGKVMLRITGYVMTLAPVAIFAALAATLTTQGPEVLAHYARFIGSFYLALGILWGLLWLAARLVVGRSAWRLGSVVGRPLLLAFSTASSEAAYPGLLEALQDFGIPKRIVQFVLPLGYSFNLDGGMMYCAFATLFVAQAYNIDLSAGQQMTLLLMLMLTSKGMAGVPRAGLVVVTAALSTLHIPAAGLVLILAVDHILDMGRSATNVIGNSVAAIVVARWEGGFSPESRSARLEPRRGKPCSGEATIKES